MANYLDRLIELTSTTQSPHFTNPNEIDTHEDGIIEINNEEIVSNNAITKNRDLDSKIGTNEVKKEVAPREKGSKIGTNEVKKEVVPREKPYRTIKDIIENIEIKNQPLERQNKEEKISVKLPHKKNSKHNKNENLITKKDTTQSKNVEYIEKTTEKIIQNKNEQLKVNEIKNYNIKNTNIKNKQENKFFQNTVETLENNITNNFKNIKQDISNFLPHENSENISVRIGTIKINVKEEKPLQKIIPSFITKRNVVNSDASRLLRSFIRVS